MGKIELTIPDSLNEIVLGQYQDYLKVLNNTENNEIFVRQKMIQYFCGLDSDVLNIKATDLFDITDRIGGLLNAKDQKLHQFFTVQGVKFGFIPDLENIPWAEFIDLDTNINNFETMHKAMAVLYRPVTKEVRGQYEIEEYKGTVNYSDVMKFAPLSVVFGALVFFWTLENELLASTQEYLAKESSQMISQLKEHLTINGDGITQSIQSLEDRLNSLTQY